MAKNALILVVEDDTDAAEVVRWLLESRGFECEVYGSAEDALDRMHGASEAVKGVIVDFHLPGIDGMEFGRQVRAGDFSPAIKLIGTTAFHTPELRATALKSGFDAYFAKPLDINDFGPMVSRLISVN